MEHVITETRSAAKGITGSGIKMVALVLMVLDHIQYFFEFTGVVPLWFSWLGRLSGWLFLFSVVEGFTHTHDRKRYFLRIWLIGAAMGVVNNLIMLFGMRSDGFYPINSIFSTFTMLMVIWQGIDWIKQKKRLIGILTVILPFALLFLAMLVPTSMVAYYIRSTILPLPFITEGGLLYTIGGIVIYLFRKNPRLQALLTSAVIILWTVFIGFSAGIGFGATLFTLNYEWMGAFAFLIILMYNGKRGKGTKKLFYLFYPGHVYIFYILSCILITLI